MNFKNQDPNLITTLSTKSPYGKYFSYCSYGLVLSVITMSCITIFGWLLQIPAMIHLTPGFISTEIIFLLISISFIIQLYEKHYLSTLINLLIAAIVFFYALTNTASLIFSVGFILFGCSLGISNFNLSLLPSIRSLIETLIFICSLVILSNYFFIFSFTSIYISISFLLLSLAFILSNKHSSIMTILTSRSHGGIAARVLFPLMIFVPLMISLTHVINERKGWLDSITSHALYTITIIAMILLVSYYLSKYLMNLDAARKYDEYQLKENEERYHQVIDMAPIGMATISSHGRFTEVNQAFCNLIGHQYEKILLMNIQDLFPSYHIVNANAFSSTLTQFDEDYLRPDGTKIWLQIIISKLKVASSQSDDAFLIEIEDITLRKEYEDKIHDLAYHDSLTQLPNRRLLLDRLEHAITVSYRENTMLAVLFLDIDQFKPVNDQLGHDVGDELLKAIAIRITATLRQEDTVSRVSGDEFIILLNTISLEQDAGIVAEKIINQIKTNFFISGHEISISASIGIALYPHHGTTTEQLLKNADYAMYQAKRAGKSQYRYSLYLTR